MHAVTKPYATLLELLEYHLESPEPVYTPGMYPQGCGTQYSIWEILIGKVAWKAVGWIFMKEGFLCGLICQVLHRPPGRGWQHGGGLCVTVTEQS